MFFVIDRVFGVTILVLIGVSQATHAAHDTKNVVVGGEDANLGGAGSLNGGIGQHKLKSSVVNTREVARAGRLVLFGAKGEGIQVDTGIGGAGVVLPRLNEVEVGAFALREAVLAVELQLGSDNGVLTPAVHVKSGLGKNEGAGIRESGLLLVAVDTEVGGIVRAGSATAGGPEVSSAASGSGGDVIGASLGEEAAGIDDTVGTGHRVRAAEGVDGVGKSIHGVGVVEGLGAEQLVEQTGGIKGRAVVDVGITLNNPDELLNGVVKVELDLVGGRADGLITGELELLDEVLVGVLGHAPALVGVEEDIVDIQRGGNEGLVVGGVDLGGARGGGQRADSPEALVDGADVEVDLDFVVLKGDEGEGKTGVAAEPELEGDVEGGLGEGVAGSANLAGGVGVAGAVNVSERGVGDVSELGGVADHLVVTALLLSGLSELVPDVHPVTVLAVNALATDFNLNLRDELLTGEVEPTGIDAILVGTGTLEALSDFGEGDLKVSAVSQITVAADSAGHAATKVGLTVKSLFNRLHSKVGVSLVRHFPEGNLRITSKIDVLCAIGDKLH